MTGVRIVDTTPTNIFDYGICGYKSMNRPGFPEKVEWLKARFSEGLRVKTLYSDADGTQGMIEYIPGEYCWRPVDAKGYTFIHCIFSGFKRSYKGKGYGSLLLGECLKDARKQKVLGVAVVTRRGSFMADSGLFVKHGFEVVDQAPSDFDLLVKTFRKGSPTPKFKSGRQARLGRYKRGLTILRADQCPYTVKNVKEIGETAREQGIAVDIVNLRNHKEAQMNPCAFGTFCIVYEGKIVAEHPISNTRFVNIMKRCKSGIGK